MKKYFKPAGAACFLFLVCLHPASALSAASEALAQWALSVAPSLLPFLIAAPALTCPEVCALLARVSGGFLRLMRLPKNSTGALLIGLLSGSPAGAAALASVPRDSADSPGAYLRAALLASGASPAFLLTGIAVGMLEAPETGWLLFRSQLIASLLTGLLLRSFGSERPSAASARSRAQHGAVLSAMMTLLTIGGYMALFSILARQLSLLFTPALETPLLAVLELAGGCRALSALPASLSLRLPLISAAACFGGISVYAQCMSFLSPMGVDALEYAVGKLVQAALAALITRLQLALPSLSVDPLLLALLILSCLVLFLMFCISHTRNKSRFPPAPPSESPL